MKAFISYTHTDEKYLKRLQVHLTQMKREALLESWTDNEISAGENLSERIESNLNDSEIFIALLSPDYIASNYCYEKEFQTALKKLEKKEIIIVPIICEPCDWRLQERRIKEIQNIESHSFEMAFFLPKFHLNF